MYQTIHETIRVAGIFDKLQFKPVWFVWKNKRFVIKKITLVSKLKEGSIEKIIYSVQVKSDVYRLDYFPQEKEWFLESIWIDD